MSLVDRVRALLGDDAVDVAPTPDGVPRVAPGSPDAVGLLLGTAREEGWRVRIEGAGTWLPADAPADLALTTRRLDKIPAIEPQDLSATAEAGIGCDLLRQQLADRGTWLALDPPGLAGRTLGSVVATATAGPLRHGFGAVRDHLLGVTFVTGDGRLVQSGGRVMKNVAGYDLTKLAAGGFGAFGVIVLVHLRLRALPRADQTLVLEGSREDLAQVADDIAAAAVQPAAHELMSPALDRRDPVGRGDHSGPPAAAPPDARRARSPAHARAGALGRARRRRSLRRLPRRRGPARRRTAAHVRSGRGVRGGRRRNGMTDRGGFEGLDSCVHCGFCLQACPTFLATGDESDSPRGRIELMRALEAGELAPADPGVALHLDRCLGCRGCEPVCPSGVGYGRGLEAARALLTERRGVPPLVRAALEALTVAEASRIVYALARLVRATGVPGRLAGWGRIRFALGMLGATAPKVGGGRRRLGKVGGGTSRGNLPQPPQTSTTSPVLLFRGCVMEGL